MVLDAAAILKDKTLEYVIVRTLRVFGAKMKEIFRLAAARVRKLYQYLQLRNRHLTALKIVVCQFYF